VSFDAGLFIAGCEMLTPVCNITLNDEPRSVMEGMTIEGLLVELKLQPKFLAVELNRRVVPRTQHSSTRLSDGDRVEIVTLVGGG
jgi:thiamine biosynthesis protein ThiS